MPPTTPETSLSFTPSFWQQLMEGGPLYLLFHLLFAISVVLALVVVLRRSALSWMLLVSFMPFIWASAAAHISFVSHLMVLDSTAPPATLIAPFLYATRLFNWGCVVSVVFIALALLCRPKNEKPVNINT
jgi:hypothetical protein